MRNPIAMFLIGAPLMFLWWSASRRERVRGDRRRVWTNLAVVLIVAAMGLTFGWRAYLIVQLLTLYIGSIAACGSSTYSTNSRVCTGGGMRTGTTGRQPAGQFLLQAAQADAVVQRQHRFHHIHHLSSKIRATTWNGRIGERAVPGQAG